MTVTRMHAGELDLDVRLVERLLASQFPEWAELPLERVDSAGTDNAIFRLGRDLAVRLPRIHWAAGQPGHEARWLPHLAPHLPVEVPVPRATGEPGEGYPWRWSVVPWLDGETTAIEAIADPARAALDLASFVERLQLFVTGDAPRAGRGAPLERRDEATRRAIDEARRLVDADVVSAEWEAALRVPEWGGRPVWIHGDLLAGNLLFRDGRLTGVIDFGGVGVGDPAGDVMTAWTFLSAETRPVFRDALEIDEPTWARGRGLALSWALLALPYYVDTNPVLASLARRAIDEVLADSII